MQHMVRPLLHQMTCSKGRLLLTLGPKCFRFPRSVWPSQSSAGTAGARSSSTLNLISKALCATHTPTGLLWQSVPGQLQADTFWKKVDLSWTACNHTGSRHRPGMCLYLCLTDQKTCPEAAFCSLARLNLWSGSLPASSLCRLLTMLYTPEDPDQLQPTGPGRAGSSPATGNWHRVRI